jgi:hypothetical protein
LGQDERETLRPKLIVLPFRLICNLCCDKCIVERLNSLKTRFRHASRAVQRSGDAVLQRHPIQKLHGDERFAMLVVNFVDRADIGVIQRRGSFRFALKPAKGLRVFGYVVGQELESHKPSEFLILSLVDHAHAATAEFLDGAVVRDGLADHEGFKVSRFHIS